MPKLALFPFRHFPLLCSGANPRQYEGERKPLDWKKSFTGLAIISRSYQKFFLVSEHGPALLSFPARTSVPGQLWCPLTCRQYRAGIFYKDAKGITEMWAHLGRPYGIVPEHSTNKSMLPSLNLKGLELQRGWCMWVVPEIWGILCGEGYSTWIRSLPKEEPSQLQGTLREGKRGLETAYPISSLPGLLIVVAWWQFRELSLAKIGWR